MITLIQYAGQNVTPENDASVYNALARGADSCLTTISANLNESGDIAFTDGYMLVQGRVVHLESHSISPALPESGTANGKIYLEIDITNTSAPCQIKTTIGAFTPTKNDINLGGTLYQLVIGTYSATATQVVANSLNITLPTNADTTFKLGFKNNNTGRASISASASSTSMQIESTDGANKATIETSNKSELDISSPSGFVGIKADGSGATIIIDNNDEGGAVTTLGRTNSFVRPVRFGGGINTPNAGTTFVASQALGDIALGQTIARIGYDSDGGRLVILNKNGDERVRLGIKGNGAGKIEIIDENGNTHNVLTD